MALFPAYSVSENQPSEDQNKDSDWDWLTSTSYQVKEQNEPEEEAREEDDASSAVQEVESGSTEPHTEHRKRHKDERRHKHRKKKEKKRRSRSPRNRPPQVDEDLLRQKIGEYSKGKVFLEEVGLKPESAFRVDSSADKNNLRFSSLNVTQIAKYKRLFSVKRCKQLWREQAVQQKARRELVDGDGETYYVVDSMEGYMSLSDDRQREEKRQELDEVADFNARLRESPRDVQLWLKFIHFQDSFRDIPQQALAEKKMAILDRALENNPGDLELMLERMRVVRSGQDASSVTREWKQLLSSNPTRIDLWKSYLAHLETHLATLSIPKVIIAYQRFFSKMTLMQQPHFSESQRPKNLELNIVGGLFKLCTMLKQSGHTERAISTMQAIVEMNYFRPDSVRDENLKLFFEPFWDSGVARFGERDALGWNKVMQQKDSTTPGNNDNAIRKLEEDILDSTRTLPEKWVLLERLRESKQCLPWRVAVSDTTAEDECEDPLRVVMFDDISPFSFLLSEHPSIRFKLLVGLVNTLVPSAAILHGHTCSVAGPGIDVVRGLDTLGGLLFVEDVFGEHVDIASSVKREDSITTHVSHDIYWFMNVADLSADLIDFVRGFVKSGAKILEEPYRTAFLSHWIHIERHTLTSDSKKMVKAMLREEHNRNNPVLFLEYASFEKKTDAIKLIQATIDSGSGYSDEIQATLHCQLAKLQALSGDRSGALKTLTHLASGSAEFTPTAQLKAQRHFQAMKPVSRTLLYQYPDAFVEWNLCKALFLYLRQGLEAAAGFFEDMLKEVPTNTLSARIKLDEAELWKHLVREKVWEAYVGVCVMAAEINPGEYARWRAVVGRAISEYPGNAKILGTVIRHERQCSVAGKLWRQQMSMLKTCASPIVPVYMCLHLIRCRDAEDSGSMGILRKVLHILEQSTSNPILSECPLLWRMLLQATRATGWKGTRRSSPWYLAVQHCPTVKAIYLDAVDGSPDEVQTVMDLMTEKQLHVRTPLEEVQLMTEVPAVKEEEDDPDPDPDSQN